MTTIVAIQGDNYSLICSDSRVSSMDEGGFASQITTLKEANGKIAYNGKYLLGAAGDMRAINILHHVFQPPALTSNLKGKKLDQFITSKFIPSLRSCFEQQGYALPERDSSNHMAEHGSTILISINGSIYIIDGDYSWTSDAYGVYALGTGSAYALGALQVLMPKKNLTPTQAKTLALKAINTASKYDPYTGSPFHCYIQETE
jgi:ATP-dependent protease HslVU (ClpYQ) peptidase subunit